MTLLPPSRRHFLQVSGATAVGAWMTMGLAGCREAVRSAAESIANDDAPRALTPEEMRALDALADRIIPADGDSPGASGARAVVAMDHMAAADPGVLEGVRATLAVLGDGFADRSAAARDEAVAALERDEPGLFGLMNFLTVVGTFGVPERGGNRDGIGWTMIGFDKRHAWQPPFGAYDAQAARGGDA